MTTQEKHTHTPTPWETGHANLIWRRYRDHKDRRAHQPVANCDIPAMLSDEEKAANAEFIVRAVNAHDALVEALRNARSMLVAFGGDPRVAIYEAGSIGGDEMQAALLDNIDAALKLVGASNE